MFGKAPRGVSERPKSTKKDRTIPSWVWLLVLVLIGLGLALFLALWRPWQPTPAQQYGINQEIEQDTNEDYRFYDLLPKQQVTPIPEQAIPEQKVKDHVMVIEPQQPKPKTTDEAEITDPLELGLDSSTLTEKPQSYILQVRSYEDPDQADARRAEIILNGLSAEVIIANEGNKIWYRVISGPYYSEEAAHIAQQTLQNGGIDSFIVKQPK